MAFLTDGYNDNDLAIGWDILDTFRKLVVTGWVLLIEPAATKHTGEEITSRTRSLEEQLGQ